MKYSLMSLMLDQELKLDKPNIILKVMLSRLGYEGPEPGIDETFRWLNAHGVPLKNGTISFRDYVRFAKENGFDGVDVMSWHLPEDGLEARSALEEYGITLSAVDLILPFGNFADPEVFDRGLTEAKELIDRVALAGGSNLLLMPCAYTPEPGQTREQVYQRMVRGLTECVAYGASKGVTVNTETLESVAAPLCSNSELLRLFDAIPTLKYSHDTGNPILALEDSIATYELFRDRVVAVHFKDLRFTEEKTQLMDALGRHLELCCFGDGVIDFRSHLRLLQRDYYQGFITLEGQRPAENQLEGAKAALAYFKGMETSL